MGASAGGFSALLMSISAVLVYLGSRNRKNLQRHYSIASMALVAAAGGDFEFKYDSLTPKGASFEELFERMVADGWIESDVQADVRTRTPREIKRSFLSLVEVVGKGQFGQVWKGMLDESPDGGAPSYMVAAKTVRDSNASPEATHDLKSEALVMMQLGKAKIHMKVKQS